MDHLFEGLDLEKLNSSKKVSRIPKDSLFISRLITERFFLREQTGFPQMLSKIRWIVLGERSFIHDEITHARQKIKNKITIY